MFGGLDEFGGTTKATISWPSSNIQYEAVFICFLTPLPTGLKGLLWEKGRGKKIYLVPFANIVGGLTPL